MKYIQLSRGLQARVDDDDFIKFNNVKWCASGIDGYPYAIRRINKSKKSLIMHREIMNPLPGEIVDHIDGDTLNNQKHNLRITNRSGNARNKKSRGKSKFMGVSWHRTKWIAHIKIGTKYKHLGLFESEIDAAKAYNQAAIENNIDFARLNIMDNSEVMVSINTPIDNFSNRRVYILTRDQSKISYDQKGPTEFNMNISVKQYYYSSLKIMFEKNQDLVKTFPEFNYQNVGNALREKNIYWKYSIRVERVEINV